ncbi:MAG: AMP-binding protein [Actinomycetota bacterium]
MPTRRAPRPGRERRTAEVPRAHGSRNESYSPSAIESTSETALPSSTDFLTALRSRRHAGSGLTVVEGTSPERLDWERFLEEAERVAASLQSLGVGPGSRVALVGDTSLAMLRAIAGTWVAGGAVTLLPLPPRGSASAAFTDQARARLRDCAPDLTLAASPWVGALEAVTEATGVRALDSVDPSRVRVRHARLEAAGRTPDSLAIIQYTSGSTSDPRGVTVTDGCLVAHIEQMVRAAGFGPPDVLVSWVPLFHDMGLIGLFALPLARRIELVVTPSSTFANDPRTWMRLMSAFRGTVTAAPNFAYAITAKMVGADAGLDLSAARVTLSASEPIDARVVREFATAAGRHGLSERSMFCVYGLAEATLAVTFPAPGEGLRTDVVDHGALAHRLSAVPPGGTGKARELVRVGRPLPGNRVWIRDQDGRPASERHVGEIVVEGPSVTSGYFGSPSATEEVFHDGSLHTGDLGYVADGELIVCGRRKDLIIVAGRNIHPEEIEHPVGRLAGVRPGNVVAFSVAGAQTEAVVVIAETRDEHGDTRLRDLIAGCVRDAVGVVPHDVVLVPPRTLPKTSSGKLQRGVARDGYLSGT